MSLEKAIEKTRKLVALSSSPHAEEARTSAYLACRLIREHGLQIIAPQEQTKRKPRQEHQEQPRWRQIVIKHASPCVVCRLEVAKGTRAFWLPGEGVRHATCEAKK